ncbi:hypothetical protein D9M68_976200 [compost metagenome]
MVQIKPIDALEFLGENRAREPRYVPPDKPQLRKPSQALLERSVIHPRQQAQLLATQPPDNPKRICVT